MKFSGQSSGHLVFALLTLVSIFLGISKAAIVGRCDLYKWHQFLNMTGDASSWLCIVRFESNYDTGSEYVLNGKTHRGLFGISEDHCKPHKRANESGLPCTNLCTTFLDNGIYDDFRCAEKLYNMEGFELWNSWNTNCRRRNLNGFIRNC